MRTAAAAALLLLPALARASNFGSSARATTAGAFLELGAGARASGMGDAYSAVADEASAVYWNPAAMTQVRGHSITLMHAAYIESTFFDYGSYVQNLGKAGAFGGALQYFSAGKIVQTDPNDNELGSVFPYDMALYFSYAYRVQGVEWLRPLEGFSFGASAKIIDSRIINTASAGAVDLGVLSPGYLDDRLRLAFTARNLGGDTLQFEQTPESLPLALKLGSAFRVSKAWLASLDFGLPKGDSAYVAAGTEYWIVSEGPWRFAGRLGFNSRTVNNVDGLTGLSLGFGLASSGWRFDYGFVPIGGLGQAHRLSLTYDF